MRVGVICLLFPIALLGACSKNTQADGAPSRVEGVIVHIDSIAIDDVNGFTLKDGEVTYDIRIADDVDYGFPLGHLQEHVQSAGPVAVDLEERDGKLYALTIEDV